MPNWVKNIVTTSEKTMNKIKEKYFENGELKFNKVIPMPKTLDIPDGMVTERAILYAMSKKEPKTLMNFVEMLKGKGDTLVSSYWEKLQNHFTIDDIRKLENEANKYIPGDEEKRLGIQTLEDLGNVCINNILEYGHTSWYHWCVDNWGTKWEPFEFSCNNNTMIFCTAWSIPEEIFTKLSEEFPDDYIEVKYADECYSNYNNGFLTYKDGLVNYEDGLDENFAAEVWDEEIEKNEKDITDEMFD